MDAGGDCLKGTIFDDDFEYGINYDPMMHGLQAYPNTVGGLIGGCVTCFYNDAGLIVCAYCGQFYCMEDECVKVHRRHGGIICVQYQLLQAVLNRAIWVGFKFPSHALLLQRLLTHDETQGAISAFNLSEYNPTMTTKVFTPKIYAASKRLAHLFKFDVNDVAGGSWLLADPDSPFEDVYDLGIKILDLGGLRALIVANQAFVLLLHQIFTERCTKLRLRWQWRFWLRLVDSAWRKIPVWENHIGPVRGKLSMSLVGAEFKYQKFQLGRVKLTVPPIAETSIEFRCEDWSDGWVLED